MNHVRQWKPEDTPRHWVILWGMDVVEFNKSRATLWELDPEEQEFYAVMSYRQPHEHQRWCPMLGCENTLEWAAREL